MAVIDCEFAVATHNATLQLEYPPASVKVISFETPSNIVESSFGGSHWGAATVNATIAKGTWFLLFRYSSTLYDWSSISGFSVVP